MRAKRAKRAKRGVKTQGGNRRTSRTKISRGGRAVQQRAAPARPKARARPGGSIGDAAARVTKSGARLIAHTGQRVVIAAAERARAVLDRVVQSAGGRTRSCIGPPDAKPKPW